VPVKAISNDYETGCRSSGPDLLGSSQQSVVPSEELYICSTLRPISIRQLWGMLGVAWFIIGHEIRYIGGGAQAIPIRLGLLGVCVPEFLDYKTYNTNI